MKIALTIAGSDSGGGAGIQADLKTFHQFGVFGTSVVVAVTAQNTVALRDTHLIPAESVNAQLQAVAEDLPPDAVKSGMLPDAGTVDRVVAAIRRYDWAPYVLDPVMAATSGARLQAAGATRALAERLVPLAAIVTPNLEEAARLTAIEVDDESSMTAAGEILLQLGAGAALVTGGHLAGDTIVDVLVTASGVRRYPHPRVPGRAFHGTGCTLSAAIAAGLALGRELEPAAVAAIDFVSRAIATAPPIGSGPPPLNHWIPAD